MSRATEWNKHRWSQTDLPAKYPASAPLFAPEATILNVMGPIPSDGSILDIGVGGGRTTAHLAPYTASYVGIDYSPEMIATARKSFPGAELHHMDARDLSAFGDESFGVVWFSFNGIDYVSHEDRLRILSEIRRVMAPGGWFMMSSHNRDFALLQATRDPRRQPIRSSPLGAAKDGIRIALSTINAMRLRKRETECDEYAIVNDHSHSNSLLTYYISVPKQTEQLMRAGFSRVRAYALDGAEIATRLGHEASYMVHYLASK